ncbi:unnamed protein product [Tilletia laevis]|uniref:Uncharacterized protein n=2 Tax=Tilletia TaxID=13289 RepID=A0A9N8LJ23_9BASI|nr:unnamed protein product [Tilletia caries]CAD6900794.1 unnamed protein product [Tilletia laevis]CAD6903316.1 unnamed protein product [Tilletia laevis]CAD6939850.1 unnamed protein product [Tilletia caries]CAD6954599.1 unnamed protein product [Tilletia caries]
MSAPTAIPAHNSQSHHAHPHSHQRQHSLGTAAAAAAASPRISSLGSAAFSFPRTGGQGVTTGPLHSPSQTRFSFSSSSAATAAPQQGGGHTRAQSGSISSFSSGSSWSEGGGPPTPRQSMSDQQARVSIVSPSSIGLCGSAGYDGAKSRVISQPWHPTLGSKWSGLGVGPGSRVDDGAPAARVPSPPSVSVSGAGPGVEAAPGRLGHLFRKLSLSTSSNVAPLPSSTSTAPTRTPHPHHHHHHRHHSMSIPPSFEHPSAVGADSKMERAHSVFAPGGSAIMTDDLLMTPTSSTPSNSSSGAASMAQLARSEPSASSMGMGMMSSQQESNSSTSPTTKARKASFGAGSRKRRPSPTGERLLSMGHFGHH